jgi:hypothetical protein
VIALLLFVFFPHSGTDTQSVAQPIAFSHKKHLLLKLKCSDCHSNSDPGEAMALPNVSRCMVCHVAITKETPDLQKLRNLAKVKQEIIWVSLNNLPDWVFWSHRTHLEANVKCEACHGPVENIEVMARSATLTNMGGCVSCHQKYGGPTGCLSCHEGKH